MPTAALSKTTRLPSSTAPAEPTVLRQHLSVPFDYQVAFTRDVFGPRNLVLRDAMTEREPGRAQRACVVVDRGVAAAWPELGARIVDYFAAHRDRLHLAGEPVVIPGGEAAKNDPDVCAHLHQLFHALRLDRHNFVVIVGGGAVLDAAGYAATTAHRGLRVVRLPTTVLAQNDSGVGVKNGVNAFGVKNFLGTFAPPWAVVNDFDFLERLPRRDRIAGLAEAAKVALIRDGAFFAWLEQSAAALAACDAEASAAMIRRCAALHLHHIATSGDPFEHGSARPLDFGHWAAHKLETLTAHDLRHGEAVALGVLLDTRYSVEAGMLAAADGERVFALMERLGLPRWHDAMERAELLDGLEDFREHLGGELTVTLLAGIGVGVERHEMDRGKIAAALAFVRRRSGTP